MEGLHHDTILDEPNKESSDLPKNQVVKEKSASAEKVTNKIKDFSKSNINKDLTSEQKLDLYEKMVRIRRFEERSLRSYQQGHIGGFLHLYIGQEAVAVGSVSVLGSNDHVITAYRDHGHALAVGMDFDECMAELYGKELVVLKVKGSMHFLRRQKGLGGPWYCWRTNSAGFRNCICFKISEKNRCMPLLHGRWCHKSRTFYESLNLAIMVTHNLHY